MLTCPPDELAAELHNRMPVIIDVADYDPVGLSCNVPISKGPHVLDA